MELNQFRDVDIVLDKANDNIIQKQFVSAGDKDGRSLTVQITENGVVGEVIGLTLNLRWHNEASGLTDLSAFSVVDRTTSVFKIDYPQNMLTPGKVIAYIQILHGGKVTHTKPFEITVQNLAGTTRGVLATAEYGALVTTLAKANEFETEIAEVTAQLPHKVSKEDKVGLENLSDEALQAIAGGEGTSFNLLSKPQEYSVNVSALSSDIRNKLTVLKKFEYSFIVGFREVEKGTVFSSPGYKYIIKNVQEGEVYNITANISGAGAAVVIFVDNENAEVSHVYRGTDEVIIHEKREVSVPNRATKMYVTTHASFSNFDVKQRVLRDFYTQTNSGKKWVAIGDSLTEKNSRTTMNYHHYIAEETGIEVINMGLSGTGYKNEEANGNAFYQRILSTPLDADVVTIFGSGNDEALPLGEITDTTTDTICGCINKTLDNFYSIHPTTPIGLITPTPWELRPPHVEGNTMQLIANAILGIGKRRSVPVLDLYHESNLRPWNTKFKQLAYSKDNGNGVHPDETGHAIIAPKVKEFLKTLITL